MKKVAIIDEEKTCFLCKNCLKEWIPAILAHKKNYKVKKGEIIFKEGDPVKGIFFVNNGIVKVHKRWGADKELILRFASEGMVFGHRALGGDGVYSISATAIQAGIVSYVDMEFFETTLKVNTDFAYKLLMFLAYDLRVSERKTRNVAHMPVKGRVAEALIMLKDQFGLTDDGYINIELSRQDLASFSGATYETVFRVINELISENLLVLSGKRISIANFEKLSKLTEDAA
ncbi:Crp/Fnr family transcriptional regulator [Mucilaginibacter corticis]|uniref:Crp/Fnr family transcriptional regulator n=1 Tax=Mucilaginibacter corticis TaxID=2597670 RepID=A0A556MTH5_9SPHI|nr:Crp/Fnr family transcriptional regulator [Mucilaginibacter corticis]TSJ43234.1 Crp/Fnr family transcriptional regulator [Mucilaginibacter corticis]